MEETAVRGEDSIGDLISVIPMNEDFVGDSISTDKAELNIDIAGPSSSPCSFISLCIMNVVSGSFDEDLVGVVVSNGDEAFELYNGYAYRVSFSVRKGQQRYKASTKSIQMKRFFCAKAGYKEKPNSGVKLYLKIDIRNGCGALVQFGVGGDEMWTVIKHVKEHNHELCSFGKSHLLRSHRRVGNNHLEYLKDMKNSGVALADGMRFLKRQSGGSPLVGFTNRDAYNLMTSESLKCLDGTDSNSLIEIFKRRQSNEVDFFFDFEVDLDGRLCSFFLERWSNEKGL
ncbi:PREDICTED: protein FAR1-RELATED SEQUENCE 5-like [Ipomoea nil]|uniref:protein FAR1-RELATED SEQUENCE 5-like n=1 Tax=Ipomoea nil TaxID=35883 RepID=UPI000901FBF7|nr:PREDICTED: protein FAR1-RELATED SEQUENCE 5-like [Ipomoea nil]